VLAYSRGQDAEVSAKAPYTGKYYLLVNDSGLLDGSTYNYEGSRFYILKARKLCRRGDMDGNGRIDYRDAFMVFSITRGLVDILQFTPAQRLAADFNGNGLVVGDLDDFLLVLDAVTWIPGRDPNLPAKSKAGDSGPELSLSADRSWRLEFGDGSAVRLFLEKAPALERPGPEAETLLSLLSITPAELTPAPSVPVELSLEQNSPNPFNPSTTIAFSVPESHAGVLVTLKVFDARGRVIRTLVEGAREAGAFSVFWDGADEAGRQVSSGVYFYCMKAGNFTKTRKMVLVK